MVGHVTKNFFGSAVCVCVRACQKLTEVTHIAFHLCFTKAQTFLWEFCKAFGDIIYRYKYVSESYEDWYQLLSLEAMGNKIVSPEI
jgi:hypothetical protein